MNNTTQDKQLNENGDDNAVPVATLSATWQVYDPRGEARQMLRTLKESYKDRFYPGEIRSDTDFLRWLIRNGGALIDHLRPGPVT